MSKFFFITSRVNGRGNRIGPVSVSVCVSVCTLGQKECPLGERGRYVNAQAFSFFLVWAEMAVTGKFRHNYVICQFSLVTTYMMGAASTWTLGKSAPKYDVL